MESITKNRQSAATLRSLIARAYGAEAVPTGEDFARELTHGWFNVAYDIRLADGRRVVLKIAPPAGVEVLTRERGMMANELAAMRLVSENTNVPVPRVDFSDASHELVDVDYFFMEYIDADNFGVTAEHGGLADDVVARATRELGAMNRELNQIAGERFGALEGPGHATWRAALLEIFAQTLADGEREQVDLGWDYETIRMVVAESADALDEVTEPRFTEVDLWDKNAMIRDGRIVAVLDHERALWGDPLMEAGFTGIDLPDFGDPADFIAGYGLPELTPAQRTRRWLYSLHLAVVMIVETKYRGHTDTETYDFARAQLDLLMERVGHSR